MLTGVKAARTTGRKEDAVGLRRKGKKSMFVEEEWAGGLG